MGKDIFSGFRTLLGFVSRNTSSSISQNEALNGFLEILSYEDSGLGSVKDKLTLNNNYLLLITPDGSSIRAPGSSDLESTDNLVGFGVMGAFLSKYLLKRIYDYGRGHFWIWPSRNIVKENIFRRWLGRQQQVVAHIKYALNIEPMMIQELWWSAAMYLSTKADINDQDAFVLSYLLYRVELRSTKRSWISRLASNYWRKSQEKRNPEGIHRYIKGWHPSHPALNYIKKYS